MEPSTAIAATLFRSLAMRAKYNYRQLPLLPEDLAIVIVKPSNTNSVNRLQRQFAHDFHVRKDAVRTWLEFLVQNHPGYCDIAVSEDNMAALPDDGSVIDRITTHNVEAVDATDDMASDDPGCGGDETVSSTAPGQHEMLDGDDVEAAAVPDLIMEEAQIDVLQRHVQGEPAPREHLDLPSFRATPLEEFNRSQALLSLAFPSLYPRGAAEFVAP